MHNEIGAVSLVRSGLGWCGAGGQGPTWGSWCACSTHAHTLGYSPAPRGQMMLLQLLPTEQKGPGKGGAHGGPLSLLFLYVS